MYKCDKTVKLGVALSVQIFRSLANLIKGYQHDDQEQDVLKPKDCETDVIADEYLYTVILKMYSPTRIPRKKLTT